MKAEWAYVISSNQNDMNQMNRRRPLLSRCSTYSLTVMMRREAHSFIVANDSRKLQDRLAPVSCHIISARRLQSSFLTEKSRHQSGKFTLVILTPTWKDDAEQNTIPLIITVEQNQPRVVGIMSPFDDLIGVVPKTECSEIGALTAVWITRKQQGHSPSA